MARIFDPSGETEFFEITELQAGFEKELKTGEKVAVAPGVKDASFLREAPIRADLAHQYEQFKDRVLNPIAPQQPPVFRCICAKVIIPRTAVWGNPVRLATPYDPATPNFGCYLRFKSTTLSTLAGAPNYNFNLALPPTFVNPLDQEIYWDDPFVETTDQATACQETASTIPGWLTMEGFIGCGPGQQLNWIGGVGDLLGNQVTINWRYGGNQTYATPNFDCLGIPNLALGTELKLWEIKADLFLPDYVSGPPGTTCYKNLTNFSFTNFYP